MRNKNLYKMLLESVNDNCAKLNYLLKLNILSIEDIYIELSNCHSLSPNVFKTLIINVKNISLQRICNLISEENFYNLVAIINELELPKKYIKQLVNVALNKYPTHNYYGANDSLIDVCKNEKAPIKTIVNFLIKKGLFEKEVYRLASIIMNYDEKTIGTSIRRLENELLDNPEYIYKFAKDIKGANIQKLAIALANSENVEYIYKYGLNIKNAPLNILANAIVKSKSAEYIYKFAKDIENAPLNILLDGIVATENGFYIVLFLKETNVSAEDIITKVLELNNPRTIYHCYNGLRNDYEIDISKVINSLKKCENGDDWLYNLSEIPNIPLKDIEEAIIEINNPKYILGLIDIIEYNSITNLENALLESVTLENNGVAELISYIRTVDKANVDKVMDKIIELFPLILVELARDCPEYEIKIANKLIKCEDYLAIKYLCNIAKNQDIKEILESALKVLSLKVKHESLQRYSDEKQIDFFNTFSEEITGSEEILRKLLTKNTSIKI